MNKALLREVGALHKNAKNDRQTQSGLAVDIEALARLRLIAVAYSHVEREWFPTEDAYKAEIEVVDRANQVIEKIKSLGLPVKGYQADEYFLTNLIVDKPDIVINLVDTYKGKDRLSTSIPAALELLGLEYTGAGMQGFVLGCNRQFTKELLETHNIPTPPFQLVKRLGTDIKKELKAPLIVKLNESGGSVGINNNAVQETYDDAKKRAEELVTTYKLPVIVEEFIDGNEITVIVFYDGIRKHVYLGEKVFGHKPDGKHAFTSLESYKVKDAWTYKRHTEFEDKISRYIIQAFNVLRHKDYGKFDIRIDQRTKVPYITDSNPNTAFGPSIGLPIMEVASLYGVSFEELLVSMLSRHAKNIFKTNGSRNLG